MAEDGAVIGAFIRYSIAMYSRSQVLVDNDFSVSVCLENKRIIVNHCVCICTLMTSKHVNVIGGISQQLQNARSFI